jgi:hypothetical protein
MTNYPCKDCILLGNCSEICDKLRNVGPFNEILVTRCCPDCGGEYIDIRRMLTDFYIIYCTNCNSKFVIDKHRYFMDFQRSTLAKGTIIDDTKYDTTYTRKFKSILINNFINDVQRGKYD